MNEAGYPNPKSQRSYNLLPQPSRNRETMEITIDKICLICVNLRQDTWYIYIYAEPRWGGGSTTHVLACVAGGIV